MTIVSRDSISPAFRAAVATSHQIGLSVQVLNGLTGSVLREITSVLSGAVTLDAAAAIRGRVELEIFDDGTGLMPVLITDDLTPFGNELRIARGVVYPAGSSELVEQGIFGIRRVETSDGSEGPSIRITAFDRWARFVDARFEEPREIAAGTNVITAITDLAQEAWPDVPLDLGVSSLTTPLITAVEGDDRGVLMQSLATSLGQELYFDGSGTLVMRPIASASGVPEWTFDDALVEAAKAWDTEGVYNRVVASGEAIDDAPPVRGVATDENPLSPTYYFGKFGRRPRFYVSQMITTEAQATDAAAGILAGAMGTSQEVTFGAVVNPAVEPGRTALITQPDLGIDELHVLDQVVIPLTPDEAMTAKTRITESEAQ